MQQCLLERGINIWTVQVTFGFVNFTAMEAARIADAGFSSRTRNSILHKVCNTKYSTAYTREPMTTEINKTVL